MPDNEPLLPKGCVAGSAPSGSLRAACLVGKRLGRKRADRAFHHTQSSSQCNQARYLSGLLRSSIAGAARGCAAAPSCTAAEAGCRAPRRSTAGAALCRGQGRRGERSAPCAAATKCAVSASAELEQGQPSNALGGAADWLHRPASRRIRTIRWWWRMKSAGAALRACPRVSGPANAPGASEVVALASRRGCFVVDALAMPCTAARRVRVAPAALRCHS